jgi:hypothetical protein
MNLLVVNGITWSKIVNICYKDERLQSIIDKEVCVLAGNGDGSSFWNDVWLREYMPSEYFIVSLGFRMLKWIVDGYFIGAS